MRFSIVYTAHSEARYFSRMEYIDFMLSAFTGARTKLPSLANGTKSHSYKLVADW